jgi:hypothetical protein
MADSKPSTITIPLDLSPTKPRLLPSFSSGRHMTTACAAPIAARRIPTAALRPTPARETQHLAICRDNEIRLLAVRSISESLDGRTIRDTAAHPGLLRCNNQWSAKTLLQCDAVLLRGKRASPSGWFN